MNIDFSRMMPRRGVDSVNPAKAAEAVKVAENGTKPLFPDALTIREKENFAMGESGDVDMDDVEKELDREDRLGKLFSSEMTWDPPDMPNFV